MSQTLYRTALHALHLRLGAKMVPFAGYDMPLYYKAGLMAEHLHTRRAAGLFDVSHMGQIEITVREGGFAALAAALEKIIPIDIAGLQDGRQRYGFFTLPNGGLLDDLMVARRGEAIFMVVNASRQEKDLAHLRAHLEDDIVVTPLENRALLALQGPLSAEIMGALCPPSRDMRFMDVIDTKIDGVACILARSGYTGEDGFELSLPAADAVSIAEKILSDPRVLPIGLGARDSLRLEAGLCLYGQDIDENTTPIEASLQWAIPKCRRAGGARAGGFPGDDVILNELAEGPAQCRVGFAATGRAPIRAGEVLYADPEAETPIGKVTSGAFGPSFNGPVAMGYVTPAFSKTGQVIYAALRGKVTDVHIVGVNFVPPGYKRS
ncbi:glycine cleavage system aminomethyltransferase GcvT [Candidatus Kirkpatrickella diaphorinae]|uniref:aminomethyltransferase n=1 Tax=Candidatus Kirkpatrickella diaphorinae TaxID=2984322 RepID=A0ABY6GHJ9_9PROT|nr:glycine cleavage system aminomethyltransferase GcvT [Candidatus Kirkpatrickella diaphorinae]UYH50988.1 glycine cleavage system aminomethyltransferase GcvT [Candidatus Kirkpatrickella diaphorinae]